MNVTQSTSALAGDGTAVSRAPQKPLTKLSLSPARRWLVELMQDLNFGRLEKLHVRDGEPVLDPTPLVRREIVFGKNNTPNSARDKDDFALKEQLIELFDLFDQQGSVTVESLVIQHGLPVRMTVADLFRVG
jgi:hypothetical protein